MKDSKIIEKKFIEAQDSLILQSSDLSLDAISSMVEKQAIDISPHYQRRERWKTDRQSALIESFLLNVPVPPIYLAEDDFGTYSVIDGKQRITAIHQFMTGNLELKDLENFVEIEGAKFGDLPKPMKNALEIRPYVRVVTLLKQSSPNLKYEVFTRLNKGGESLNPQEIRNVAFRGPLNELIYQLSENEFLRHQMKIKNEKTPAYQKMQDAEYVLRFLTLHKSWREFSGSLIQSMDSFMRDNQHMSDSRLGDLEKSFNHAIQGCQNIWGDKAFQRPSGNTWRDQFLAGMYDAQMLAVSAMTQGEINNILGKKDRILDRTRRLFEVDAEFEQAVRQGTNTPSRIVYRVEAVLKMLQEI